tara:strand:+ start:509 stop:655 length:147 start_codon:yes stop_codon:yes gene_type:complete
MKNKKTNIDIIIFFVLDNSVLNKKSPEITPSPKPRESIIGLLSSEPNL